jgi:Protein of unknown function (DUF2489)
MSLPDTLIASNRQKVASIAQDMVDGRIAIIDGSRQLAALLHRIDVAEFDDDFMPFVGIDSATDSLPIGESRKHWASDALEKKDAEIAGAEEHWGDYALSACTRLVARFGSHQ